MDPQPETPAAGDRSPEEEPFVVRTNLLRPLASFIVALLFVFGLGLSASVGSRYWFAGFDTLAEDLPQRSIVVGLQWAFLVWVLLLASPLLLIRRRGVVLTLGPAGMWIGTGRPHEPLVWVAWNTVSRIWLQRQIAGWRLRVQTHDPATFRTVPLAFSDRRKKEIRAALASLAPMRATTDAGR